MLEEKNPLRIIRIEHDLRKGQENHKLREGREREEVRQVQSFLYVKARLCNIFYHYTERYRMTALGLLTLLTIGWVIWGWFIREDEQ